MTYQINITIVKDSLPEPEGEYSTCNFRITTTSSENSDIIFIDNINCQINKEDDNSIVLSKINTSAIEFIERKYGKVVA